MAGCENTNNRGVLRSTGEAIGAIGLGIIVALDVAVVNRCAKNESIDNLLPAVGVGVGAVAVGVALMIADTPKEN